MSSTSEQSLTHLSKSDRVLMYVIFVGLLALTVALYHFGVGGDISRLSAYATALAFLPASWAWLAGHYDKKHSRRRLAQQESSARPELSVVRPQVQGECNYAYKGEVTPLADALGRMSEV